MRRFTMTITQRVAIGLFCVLAGVRCGSSAEDLPIQQPTLRGYDCGSGVETLPPTKLILHPSGGISGRYLVVLRADVAGVAAVATDLARIHSGSVFAVWDSIHAFGMNVADAEAGPLSEEARVCYVEQDATVTAAAR